MGYINNSNKKTHKLTLIKQRAIYDIELTSVTNVGLRFNNIAFSKRIKIQPTNKQQKLIDQTLKIHSTFNHDCAENDCA